MKQTAAAVLSGCVALLKRGTKPTVPEVLPLVNAFYQLDGNGAGGSLHIVLDDANISDDHVRYCWLYACEREDAVGTALAEVLLLCSKTQRVKLSNRHGY